MKHVRAVVALHVDPDTTAGRLGLSPGRAHGVLPGAPGRDPGPGRTCRAAAPVGRSDRRRLSVHHQRLPVRAPFGRFARSGRGHFRLHPGRHQRQHHSRAGRAEGNDPDPERGGGHAGSCERIKQIAFGLSEASGATIQVQLSPGHRRRGQRPRGDPDLRPRRRARSWARPISTRSPCPAWAERISPATSSTPPAACCGWAWPRPTDLAISSIHLTSTSTNRHSSSGPRSWLTAWSCCRNRSGASDREPLHVRLQPRTHARGRDRAQPRRCPDHGAAKRRVRRSSRACLPSCRARSSPSSSSATSRSTPRSATTWPRSSAT